MSALEEHQAKINETLLQISLTNSPIRKKQLGKHLKRLRRELITYNYLQKRSKDDR